MEFTESEGAHHLVVRGIPIWGKHEGGSWFTNRGKHLSKKERWNETLMLYLHELGEFGTYHFRQ